MSVATGFQVYRGVWRTLAGGSGIEPSLTRGERTVLALTILWGILTFGMQGLGLYALVGFAVGTSSSTMTLGALLGFPSAHGFLAQPLSIPLLSALVVCNVIGQPVEGLIIAYLAQRATMKMRLKLLRLVANLPHIHAGAIPSGEISGIALENVWRCAIGIQAASTAVKLIFGASAMAVVLLAQQPALAVAATAGALPLALVYAKVANKNWKDTAKAVDARCAAFSGVTENVRSLASIKAAGGGPGIARAFATHSNEIFQTEMLAAKNLTILQLLTMIVPLSAATATILYAWYGQGLQSAQTIIRTLFPFVSVGARLGATASYAASTFVNSSIYLASFAPVLALEERLRGLTAPRTAGEGHAEPDSSFRHIEIRDLGFRLPNGTWLFRGLSTTIAPGKPLVLRGRSGSGKSTLASLVSGGNEPTEGKIVYVDVDGGETPPRPNAINYLSQDPAVFSGTIRENLLVGSEAEISDESLVAAMKQASLWEEFVVKGGLDAPVFEGGRNLSGGQLRRLGLARLLARKRGIWIFDEATASLDPASALVVERMIREVSAREIAIVISHDPTFDLPGATLELGRPTPPPIAG
jgi:ABC-type multidrug transport system fused ATPase/permease subunit